jgi:hypothetical protein
MSAGVERITSSLSISPYHGVEHKKGWRKYTWNDGVISSYLGYIVCRGLLVDFKRVIDNLDKSCNVGGVNSIIWTRFSQRVADRTLGIRFETTRVARNRDRLDTGTVNREFRYKDIDSIIEFFDDTYAEMFSEPDVYKKIEPFLSDMLDGVGEVSETFSTIEGGMTHHTLLKKAFQFISILPHVRGRGFTGIGETRMEGDYFSQQEAELRSIRNANNAMESTYLKIFWDVMNRVVSIMSAADRVLSYHQLYNIIGEHDTWRNPCLVTFSSGISMSASSIQSIIQLDGLFGEYKEKKSRRRMSLLGSRLCYRMGTYRGM